MKVIPFQKRIVRTQFDIYVFITQLWMPLNVTPSYPYLVLYDVLTLNVTPSYPYLVLYDVLTLNVTPIWYYIMS
jgi:hypothetical protein